MLQRDGHQCTKVVDGQRCTAQATDVDHVQHGDDHSFGNLTSLCDDHHKAKSSAEGNAARWAKQGTRKRPAERHPGLL